MKLTNKLQRVLVIFLLIAGSVIFLMPFYMSIAMALKSPGELARTGPLTWPKEVTWANFAEVLSDPQVSFARLFFNTIVIAVTSTLGVILSSSAVAYGFSRIKFPGRDRLFLVLLGTMMLPGIVTLIPSYMLFKEFRWINTPLPLIVPAFFGGGAFNIFLLRQFFLGIPRELDEAARIDGASHFVIFSRIVMPLSKAALATVAVLAFIYNWRDFMGPLIYLNDSDRQTLEIGLSTYNSLQSQHWSLLMAGSVMVTLPLIGLFFLGQRFFIQGISMSGGK